MKSEKSSLGPLLPRLLPRRSSWKKRRAIQNKKVQDLFLSWRRFGTSHWTSGKSIENFKSLEVLYNLRFIMLCDAYLTVSLLAQYDEWSEEHPKALRHRKNKIKCILHLCKLSAVFEFCVLFTWFCISKLLSFIKKL